MNNFHGLVQLVRRYLVITVNTLPRDKLLIFSKFSKYSETIPIIYATAERIFSSLKHLVTYFHSTNAKELTDSYDLISVAKEFVFISRKCRWSRPFREAYFFKLLHYV